MAPSIPLVSALLAASHATDSLDDMSMLQMPMLEQQLEADQDECRCPGYYQEECEAEAAQGCVWSAAGSSNGAWCQCLGEDTRPPPLVIPALQNENENCWTPCSQTAGPCEFCGTEGVCCREGFDSDPEECGGLGGGLGSAHHSCRLPVEPPAPEFILASTDMKCPNNHGDRLFRSPATGSNDISLAACHLECQNTETCAHFSWGQHGGGNVCMGCTTLQNAEEHVGFNTYDMAHSTPPVQMINNWNFESMTADGVEATLEEGKWIHFLNNGNSGLTNPGIPGWQQMGSGAGASGLFNSNNNEIAAEGSHVLFLNSGDNSNYVYQDLLQPFTTSINIEAAVCGGNGGHDGGYRFGLYSEDGTLLQEAAAGVNEAPVCNGSQYILTHLSISADDHPAMVGQILQLRLMKNRNGQGHYHYIRFT